LCPNGLGKNFDGKRKVQVKFCYQHIEKLVEYENVAQRFSLKIRLPSKFARGINKDSWKGEKVFLNIIMTNMADYTMTRRIFEDMYARNSFF
jgi:hypothetical protein